MQPCQTAVNDANSYTAAGVLVYSILYGDQSNAPYCQDYDGDNESPQITPADRDGEHRGDRTR